MSKDQHPEVQEKIRHLLEGAERERAQKRVAYGLAELGRGKIEYLANSELLAFLPNHIGELWECGSFAEFESLLGVLEKACLTGDVTIRERALALLSIAISHIGQEGAAEQVERISELLTSWLQRETELLPGYEVVALQLEQLLKMLLELGSWRQAGQMLHVLNNISNGKLEKSTPIVRLATGIQYRAVDKKQVQVLLAELTRCDDTGTQNSGEIHQLLLGMGRTLVPIAFDILQDGKEEERTILVEILAQGCDHTVAEIEGKMASGEASVQVTSAMVRVLSRMNRQSLYPRLAACLEHPAVEVQREVVRGIIHNGLHIVPRLLDALAVVDDRLKVLVIKYLSRISDRSVNTRFLAMLDDYTSDMEIRNRQVVTALVVALGQDARPENLAALQQLKRSWQSRADSILIGLLEESISKIQLALRRAEHRVVDADNIEFSNDPERYRQAGQLITEIQQEVDQLVGQGKTEQVLRLLKAKILDCLLAGEHTAAEELRDLILATVPDAIEVLLEAEELLTKHREHGLQHFNVPLWEDLSELLGDGAFTQFLELAVVEQYQAGELIIAQGERDENLYFLASGTASLHCGTGKNETFLKKVKDGAVLAAGTVFAVSLSTFTVKAQTTVRVYSLSSQAIDNLEKMFPGSLRVLQDYCKNRINIPDLLKMSGVDRRNLVRRRVKKTVATKILDLYGVVGKRSLKGRLKDISYGGVCYEISIDSANGIRRLLGRQMQIIFNTHQQQIALNGKFVGFERNEAEEGKYFVHVQMLEPIDPKLFELIVQDTV